MVLSALVPPRFGVSPYGLVGVSTRTHKLTQFSVNSGNLSFEVFGLGLGPIKRLLLFCFVTE
jgi:hypothetical protein